MVEVPWLVLGWDALKNISVLEKRRVRDVLRRERNVPVRRRVRSLERARDVPERNPSGLRRARNQGRVKDVQVRNPSGLRRARDGE